MGCRRCCLCGCGLYVIWLRGAAPVGEHGALVVPVGEAAVDDGVCGCVVKVEDGACAGVIAYVGLGLLPSIG